MSILDYLVGKSKVAKELDDPTLEELLMPYCGPEASDAIPRLSKLLECLPALEVEPLKISNCMLDGTLPYDSLISLSTEDIKELATLVDYLYLPAALSEKLQSVLEKGTTGWTDMYDLLKIIKNGDLRGIEHICDTLDKFHINYECVEDDEFVFNDAAQVAASYGHLDILKWLDKRVHCNYSESCVCAAGGGHLECLKWLVETCLKNETIPKSCIFELAAKNGHIECLQYLHSCGFEFTEHEFSAAAAGGQLHCMQFLHEVGVPMNARIFKAAANHGNLDNLKWLREQGCPWDKAVPAYSANKGHLDCLIWLHEQGCPWDDYTTEEAAGGGQLECLKYAHTHGCPWTSKLCEAALLCNKLDCLKYAIENGCSPEFKTYHSFRSSESLKYMYENGYLSIYKDKIEKALGIAK